MEGWYKDLITDPDEAHECFVNDYAPLASLLATLSGDVLDVGGGIGIVRYYLPHGTRYTVIDPDLGWLEPDWAFLAEHFPSLEAKPRFVRAIGEYLPFPAQAFDAVLAFWSLNHASDPELIFSEVCRVLRPGGRFLVVLEDMPPSWGDIANGTFPASRVAPGGGDPGMGTPAHPSGQEWPLQGDHIRIRESDIRIWASQGFEVEWREWIGQYLAFGFRKTESPQRVRTGTKDTEVRQNQHHIRVLQNERCNFVRRLQMLEQRLQRIQPLEQRLQTLEKQLQFWREWYAYTFVKPLVSVVIVFLNTERFIEEAVESVFAQTYETWELLLVDDGSTDASTQIARRYAVQYPEKVRYLEHPGHQNRGISASRNLGIRHAKGEYVAFLDSDDVWLAPKLEQQVAILGSRPEVSMLYGSTLYWYSWTGNPKDYQRDNIPELGVQPGTLVEPPTLLTLLYPLGNPRAAPSLSNLLLRREAAERLGGFEENFQGIYQLYEDQAFLIKVYLNEPVFVASECWDRYRQHPDSCITVINKAGQYVPARLFFLAWLGEYLSEREIIDPEIWKLLQENRRLAQVQIHLQKRERKRAMGWILVLMLYHPRVFFQRFFGKIQRLIPKLRT